jgi:MarR family transcriptional regulator, transcriptional regulator for hemolysin
MRQLVDPDSFGFLITDLSRLLRAAMDRRVTEAGLGVTPGEARTLAHAARAGAVRQIALAERMGVEPMTLSGFIDRLEARGLVRRTVDPTDRRARLIELMPAAHDVLTRIRGAAAEIRAQAAQSVDAETWALLMDTLKIARANLAEGRATSRFEREDAA